MWCPLDLPVMEFYQSFEKAKVGDHIQTQVFFRQSCEEDLTERLKEKNARYLCAICICAIFVGINSPK